MQIPSRKLFMFGKLVKIVLLVMMVVIAVSAVSCLMQGLGYMRLPGDKVVSEQPAVTYTAGPMAFNRFVMLAYSLCLICVFAYGIKITKKLTSDENPFNAENAVLLRRGALLIGVSAVPKVIFTAASAVQEGCSLSVALFSAVSAALILILVSIFLGFLSQVFAYGSELQQLSDETL